MVYLFAVLLAIVNVGGLVAVLVGLPGTWLMLAGTALFAWWGWDEGVIGGWTLLVLLVLALVGELVEFVAGMAGAERAGGGWRGSLGALLGGVVGALAGCLVPVPVLGVLLGSCVGAGAGAWLLERRAGKTADTSRRIGWGAGVGRLWGTLVKLGLGVVIWIVATVASFWP